ncbi:uncharacterized protein LOC131257549 [Magnolia sinica]|uniref:uncharacterized protein LOC131257549 n=1 Tax=Magnolia sinica TaxID=86752 RepID=UPI00265B036C|nr:uncharacterized protein LOC131257549 [Magnolia sinica]
MFSFPTPNLLYSNSHQTSSTQTLLSISFIRFHSVLSFLSTMKPMPLFSTISLLLAISCIVTISQARVSPGAVYKELTVIRSYARPSMTPPAPRRNPPITPSKRTAHLLRPVQQPLPAYSASS